jgi:hypothetical protein
MFKDVGNAFEDNVAAQCCKYGGDKICGIIHRRANGLCSDYEPIDHYDWGNCVSCKNLNGMKFEEYLKMMYNDFGDIKSRRFFRTFVKVSKRERMMHTRKPFNRFSEIDLIME